MIKVRVKLSMLLFTPADGYHFSLTIFPGTSLTHTSWHSGVYGLVLFLALALEGFGGMQHTYSGGLVLGCCLGSSDDRHQVPTG